MFNLIVLVPTKKYSTELDKYSEVFFKNASSRSYAFPNSNPYDIFPGSKSYLSSQTN